MSSWTSGYVADIGYTFGYYRELSPLRIKLAFLNSGLAFPECGAACELGFGQGVSTNIHAATSMTQWYGNDFNPSQAAFAQEMAKACGNQAQLCDDSFQEFFTRNDLPDFDFIGLHGIWSWISNENRELIVDFIRRKLKTGGVLYISYNTLPGWAAFAPMRHLMTTHAELYGAEGSGIVNRIEQSLNFAEKLLDCKPLYANTLPGTAERLRKLKEQNRHYLAHEYFNKDWHPMHFATMESWLEPAKLSYACSAHYLDQIDGLNLTVDQQQFLRQYSDKSFRETVRDFMVNQQFRKDYWVKGPRQLQSLKQIEMIGQERIVLITPRSEIKLKATGALGEGEMSAQFYSPVLDFLSDHQVTTIETLFQSVRSESLDFVKLIQVVMVLCGVGYLSGAQDEDTIRDKVDVTRKLNKYIMKSARTSEEIPYLASPVIAGAIAANRAQQLFALAVTEGLQTPTDWANYVWGILSSQSQKLIREGKTLESNEENVKELNRRAQDFQKNMLPVLKALHIL